MKRTIFSSFLFLYPLNVAYKYSDIVILNLSAIGIGLSIANHAHTYHQLTKRKNLFNIIDTIYMHVIIAYTIYPCFTTTKCVIQTISLLSVMVGIFFSLLGGTKLKKEEYSKYQKIWHVIFHIISIIGITKVREICYWNIDATL